MSTSTTCRIQRGSPPAKKIPRTKTRRALEELVRDFAGRCAYSCQHYTRAGGMRCMEVDHFDYRQKNHKFQDYENLFLATRHCNGAKRQKPTAKERKAGLRLLNPCSEWDYGPHIVEDPDTHELVGLTPLGKYQIRTCDLNAEHLVMERRDRTEIWRLIRRNGGISVSPDAVLEQAREAIEALRKQLAHMIPELPLLSKTTPPPPPTA